MFPKVTGSKLFIKNVTQVTPSTPANMPAGINVIFATLCSNPQRTKTNIGKKIARILPATFLDAKAIHTAKQTNMLQSMPLIKVLRNGIATFALAVEARADATFSAENAPHCQAKKATMIEPMKFPM